MDFMNYITENALILIPVLYVLGMFLKALEFIKDKYIPCILLVLGIGFSTAMLGFNVDSIVQGILVAGATVLCNNLLKQSKKEMNSMLPIQRKISPYNNGSRNGNSIKYIVIHYTANKGDTAKNNADYFYGGNRSASAHYFVDDNSIWQVVEESRAAWHVGDGKGRYGITNQNSIGIEQCCQSNGEISAKTESNCIELVKYLQSKHGISNSNIVRHYDASRKMCPNWSANNWSRWWSFKDKLSNKKVEIDEMSWDGTNQVSCKMTIYAHSTDVNVYYRYYSCIDGNWTDLTGWQHSNKVDYVPKKAGKHKIVCHVKYKTKLEDKEDAYNFIEFDVKPKPVIYKITKDGEYFGQTSDVNSISEALKSELEKGTSNIEINKK